MYVYNASQSYIHMVGGGLGATHLTTAMQLETDATNVTCLFHYMQLAQNNPPDRRNTLTNLTTTVGENNMFFTSTCLCNILTAQCSDVLLFSGTISEVGQVDHIDSVDSVIRPAIFFARLFQDLSRSI